MGYFSSQQAHFRLWNNFDSGNGLRRCQMGAYWATWAHFTVTNEPALLSLPTGAGKTELMIALSFAFQAERVLVITPAEILRDQTAERFQSMAVLKQIGVVKENIPAPAAISNGKQLKTKKDWSELDKYDVVTATPKTVSSAEEGVCMPPVGLFDLVFLDEAHHAEAPTWAALVKDFAGSKRVFLTATPFRRDRKRIQAPLVYHYPMGKAIEDGIYSRVTFHPVTSTNSRSKDADLARRAGKLLRSERKKGYSSRLLIRTDRVPHAGGLVDVYAKLGIKTRAVDYQKTSEENAEAIRMLKRGELDGLICVGMLGEGLDLPDLRIAVMHAVPKSLPFTLQFVGRVTRAKPKVGPSHLLAIPDEVKGEVRRLFRNDASWQKLVPALVEAVIGKVSTRKPLRTGEAFEHLDIRAEDLKIFLSTRVYALKRTSADLAANFELPEGVEEAFREDLSDENIIVVITIYEKQPAWAKDTALLQPYYDLHVYYYSEKHQLLFEVTSNASIAKKIRAAISTESAQRLAHHDLVKVMNDSGDSYLMVGLRNTLGQASSHPAYKTYMGAEVQATVRPTDGRAFAPGHALVRDVAGTTRGFGSSGSRVWSIKRTSITEFKNWADSLGALVRSRLDKHEGLPQLQFLAAPQPLGALTDFPVAIAMDPTPLLWRLSIRVDGKKVDDGRLDLAPYIVATDLRDERLNCLFEFSSQLSPIELSYRTEGLFRWQVVDKRDLTLTLEMPSGETDEFDLLEFLTEFPPVLVLPKGGTIIGDSRFSIEAELPPIPSSIIRAMDWSGCEITAETKKNVKSPGKLSIHEWVAGWLRREYEDSIVINDDLKGEIADLVAIEPTKKLVSFYHCKFSGRKESSTRITDGQEVVAQACRSAKWIGISSLISELVGRVEGSNRPTKVVVGSVDRLKQVEKNFATNEWRHKIVIVQPGFKAEKLPGSTGLRPLLTTAYEWIRNSNAEFEIWANSK